DATHVRALRLIEKYSRCRRIGIDRALHNAVTLKESKRDHGIEPIAHVSRAGLQVQLVSDFDCAFGTIAEECEQLQPDCRQQNFRCPEAHANLDDAGRIGKFHIEAKLSRFPGETRTSNLPLAHGRRGKSEFAWNPSSRFLRFSA